MFKNLSGIQSDTIHGDTQGQNTPIWGPAVLSPAVTQYIHQFGRYDLDMEKRPPELVYDL